MKCLKKLAIFDLDGTLLDSQRDIAEACNEVLAAFGLPTHSVEAYARFIGHGLQKLLERVVPASCTEDADLMGRLKTDYLERYGYICDGRSTFYPGVSELLGVLRQNGIKVAIATNKPDDLTHRIIDSSLPGLTDAVYGQRPDIAPKPNPAVIEVIMKQFGIDAQADVVYVGDSEVDIQTARNGGVPCVGVTWGTRSRAELEEQGAAYIAQSMQELETVLLGM